MTLKKDGLKRDILDAKWVGSFRDRRKRNGGTVEFRGTGLSQRKATMERTLYSTCNDYLSR